MVVSEWMEKILKENKRKKSLKLQNLLVQNKLETEKRFHYKEKSWQCTQGQISVADTAGSENADFNESENKNKRCHFKQLMVASHPVKVLLQVKGDKKLLVKNEWTEKTTAPFRPICKNCHATTCDTVPYMLS